jgi:hypothetical protein
MDKLKSINDIRRKHGLEPLTNNNANYENMSKAIEHERSFGQKQDTDIIKKRMDSDLFKGGLR